ncbi:hypothetical protein PVNG_06177 [Plasmodium vivax North Korean]|uniref:Variable surface protein n=1 Tax=Plasmodium vivax North Korean TaxID=1035514 RepID=A0A0J9U0W9_PLAVI|nr:hypothetical protein PVNG_06177 [Plasmodium vivax North Korean]
MYTILESDIGYYEEGVDNTEIIKLLKEQNLYKLYEKFDNELTNSPNSKICDGEYINKLPKNEGIEKKLFDLCKKMCNLLLNFSEIVGFCTENSCCGKFPYLNIWLYEKVKEISSSSSTSSSLINNFYNALNKIKETKTPRLKYCPIINFDLYSNDFMRMKYLYEFVHIFSDIKKKISHNHGWEDKIFCKHIQEFFKYYNEIKGNCTKPSGIIYCNEVNSIPRSIDGDVINTILSKCNYEKIKCKNDSSGISVIPCLKEKEDKSAVPKTDGVPDELVRTLSTGIISLIPIVTTISIFYKKKNITEHIREVNHDILDHNSRIEEINLNNDRYNIKYN